MSSNVVLEVCSTVSGCTTQGYLILSLTGPGIAVCNVTVSNNLPSAVTTTANWKSPATHKCVKKGQNGVLTHTPALRLYTE